MSSIAVYGGRAGSAFRVHWMLAELGLHYETKPLDMAKGEHKSPAYLALNPAGQVPTLIHDGFVLTESAAIVHYLAEKHDAALLGATPEIRATGLRWELFVMLNVHVVLSPFAREKFRGTFQDPMKAAASEGIAKYMMVLEAWLSRNAWLAGPAFTTADIVARSAFQYAEMLGLDLTMYPSFMTWMERCSDRPAYGKAKG
jgi:glutathione S-transferase